MLEHLKPQGANAACLLGGMQTAVAADDSMVSTSLTKAAASDVTLRQAVSLSQTSDIN